MKILRKTWETVTNYKLKKNLENIYDEFSKNLGTS